MRNSFACIFCLGLLVACGGDEERLKMQRDIANLQEQIYQIEQQQSEIKNQASAMSSDIQRKLEDRTAQAELQDQLLTLRESLSQYEARIHDLENQMAQMSRTAASVYAQPKPSGETVAAPDAISGSDVENQFNQSLLDFNRGKFDVAGLGFEEIIQNFPDATLAEGAYYYLGRCKFEKREWQKAAANFENVRIKFSKGDYVRQSMYYLGQCYYYMNAHSKAVLILRDLRERHPGTQEAELARAFLRKAGYEK